MTSKEEKQTESSIEKENQPIIMKNGDYTIHILIKEVINLIGIKENHLSSTIIN